MTQETVEAPRPAPMEESDEEFVRAGVVTSARRRDGPVPHAATVASRAGVRGGQGRAAQAGAEAEEGRRAAQGPGQEAAGEEEKRLELRRGVEWRAVSRSGAFSLGARRRDDVEAPPPLTEPAQARTTSP